MGGDVLAPIVSSATRFSRSDVTAVAVTRAKRITSLQTQERLLGEQLDQLMKRVREPGVDLATVVAQHRRTGNRLAAVQQILSVDLRVFMKHHGSALAPRHRALATRIEEKQVEHTKVLLEIVARRADGQSTVRLDASSTRLAGEIQELKGQMGALEREALSKVLPARS